jgi:hypothetical protein
MGNPLHFSVESASPSTLMYSQRHAPSIFMGSFLFLGQCAYRKPR